MFNWRSEESINGPAFWLRSFPIPWFLRLRGVKADFRFSRHAVWYYCPMARPLRIKGRGKASSLNSAFLTPKDSQGVALGFPVSAPTF